MSIIAISQRVDTVSSYNEKRDALDQRWSLFLKLCGCVPILIPNNPDLFSDIIDSFGINGIILTGGNDLQRYGGNAPERDETESLLIKYSIENKIPLIGVCRGMQKILDYFGETLEKVTDHVGVNHSIFFKGQNRKVNSYHNWGVKEISSQFNVLAKSVDGCIESIEHKEHSILGVMWHPERNLEFENLDIDLFRSWLRVKK